MEETYGMAVSQKVPPTAVCCREMSERLAGLLVLLKVPIIFDWVGGLQRIRVDLEFPGTVSVSLITWQPLSNLKKSILQEVAGAQRKEKAPTQLYYLQSSAFDLVRFSRIQGNPSLWT